LPNRRKSPSRNNTIDTISARPGFISIERKGIGRPRTSANRELVTGTGDANTPVSMIQANCRARFTAADFDFVVRILARSQTDHVSLADLFERRGDARLRP
jgi:hypothetical protein